MLRLAAPSALAVAGSLVLALAGCSGATDTPPAESAAPAQGEQAAGAVDDQTRSPAYSIDVASVRALVEGGKSELQVRANVKEVSGDEFAPIATVLYEDGTTVECRFDPKSNPKLDAAVKELKIPCSTPLRPDDTSAQITILDEFTRLV